MNQKNKKIFDLSTYFSYFIIIISLGLMLILYIYQGLQLNENIKQTGYSILNSLITDTRHSLQKGERNTFQGVLDKISTLEDIKDVSLYTPNKLMTYKANEITVGFPFLKVDDKLVNPNEDLYIQSNGAYIRNDWSFRGHSMGNHSELVENFDALKNIESKKCSKCHFTIKENLKFDEDRFAHIIEKDRSYFYYDIPVERNCISCHTHWKVGKSAGYLSISMDNVKVTTQSDNRLQYFFMILVVVIISFLVIGYFIKQLNKKLETTQIKLEDQANHDSMTGLYNRRSFYHISKKILLLAQRNFENIHIIMLDIDNFKSINDTYGHNIGDKVIIALANQLSNSTRKSDIAVRWGGEEFLILLPKTDEKGALSKAEEIRSSIAKLEVENVRFTVSIGVAALDYTEDAMIDDAIKKADYALYEAKNSGKNRVCTYI